MTKIRRAPQTAVGLIAFAIAGCALASRYVPITNHVMVATAAVSPYLLLSAIVSVVLLVLARRWPFAALAVAVTVAMFAVQIPLYVGSNVARTWGVPLRIITANLAEGRADPHSLLASAGAQADVLAVQELTPEEVGRLSAAGLDVIFPYRSVDAREGAGGGGVWSRFPLFETRRIGGYSMALVSARVHVPGVSMDPTIAVVHLAGPWPQPIDDWRRDFNQLPATLSEVAGRAGEGPVIVAGDFNSTTDMRPFRGLLRNGYRDAAEQSGAGIKPTFPADARLPPFIAVDHILTRNCTAASLSTLQVPRSDHRAVAATVMIPASPASL